VDEDEDDEGYDEDEEGSSGSVYDEDSEDSFVVKKVQKKGKK
jgi:hypothetical protein